MMRLPAFVKNSITALRLTLPYRREPQRWPHTVSTPAGVPMSPDIALENPTVWAATKYLTQTVAQLPKRVMRETARGVSERVPNHPVGNLFAWRPNAEMSPFQFVETMTGWAILYGNAVAEIEPDNAGRVVALWPIHPDRVNFYRACEPMVDARGTPIAEDELYYMVSNGSVGPRVVLAARNVFHIRGYGNGPIGLSVIAYAAKSLGWAKATELFGSTFFGDGLSPTTGVEVPGAMPPKAKDALEAELSKVYSGPRGKKWIVLDGGMKWSTLSTAPNKAQFLETMQFQVETVCRWIGVPPQKVHHLLRMTNNNIESLSIEVVVDAITPWAIRWEEEANYKLFGQNRQGFFLKFDMKGLLRGAFKDRQDGLQTMRRNGVINADEWRELEDLGPSKASGTNIFIVENNMTRLDLVGETPQAQPAPAPSTGDPKQAPIDPAADPAAALALLKASAILGMPEAEAALIALDATLESENVS